MCLNIPCTLLQIAAEFLKYSFFVNGGKIVLPRAVKREFSLGITESGLVKRTDNKIRLSELIYKKKQNILSIKPKMTWFLFDFHRGFCSRFVFHFCSEGTVVRFAIIP